MRLPSSLSALPTSLLLTLPLILSETLAVTLTNGLKIDVTKAVQCDRKTHNGDKIFVHYRGTLVDGTEFDSSYNRGEPLSFVLGAHRVIRGWDLGLLDMCIWEQRNLTIPASLAYGDGDMGVIPAGSTLIFQTELRGIAGVEAGPSPTADEPIPASTSTEVEDGVVGIQTAAPQPEPEPEKQEMNGDENEPGQNEPSEPGHGANGECKLLGPFSLFVQGALGLLALLSLVYKRWREKPRRPYKIWFFDVSKQVVGAVILHILNLLMSMLSSGKFDAVKAAPAYIAPGPDGDEQLQQPNGCSFYLLNLAIDTTIGIPILVFFLHILHALFLRTPLANPPQSLTSGNYGRPPKFTWWSKQFLIYVIGLVLMKFCVFALFQLFPWLGWIGDWALKWTEGNERLQIAFVMFIFPLIMNAAQYWIIDSFIKDPSGEAYAYEEVNQEHDEGDENEGLIGERDEDGDGDVFTVGDDQLPKHLKEANPTPISVASQSGATSSSGSLRGREEDDDKKRS